MSQTKTYQKGDLTVSWEPDKCIHSKKCWKGLGQVFKPTQRPWIQLDGAEEAAIMAQIDQCPSGALSYSHASNTSAENTQEATKVEVMGNGPLLVHGICDVVDSAGNVTRREKTTAFCRCGHSANKPYCDGAHKREGFQG